MVSGGNFSCKGGEKVKKLIAILLICSFVLSCGIVASAEESAFVTYSDGKSYDGLPDFPTYLAHDMGGYVYSKVTAYYLYWSESAGTYYLICTNSKDGKVYKNVNSGINYFCGVGSVNLYFDTALTNFNREYPLCTFTIYRCGVGGTSWSCLGSTGNDITKIAYTDTLLQASEPIYNNSSFDSVFTQPTKGPLISGVSSAMITGTVMKEVVGLVPSVIGLIILLTAFWMAWRLLRQVLQTA